MYYDLIKVYIKYDHLLAQNLLVAFVIIKIQTFTLLYKVLSVLVSASLQFQLLLNLINSTVDLISCRFSICQPPIYLRAFTLAVSSEMFFALVFVWLVFSFIQVPAKCYFQSRVFSSHLSFSWPYSASYFFIVSITYH